MKKAITIDFWNTLYDSSNGIERNKYRQRILINELDKFGIMVLADEYDKAMKATWNFFEASWKNEHRTPTARECVEYFWDFVKIPKDKESIDIVTNAFEDSVIIHKPKLINNVKESLDFLSNEFDLAIISDTGFSPGSILKQLMIEDDIEKYFKSYSFSNETGYSKPNENAFKVALDNLDVLPSNSLHIGDIEHTDIVGAKNYGMKSIRFSGSVTEYTTRKNTQNTLADFETDSWTDIVSKIKNFL